MVDYGDFTKFQVQSMVADYCKEITLGLTGWGVSFTDWVELKGVARHDKLFRLVRMNDQATTAPTVDADGSHAEFKCPKCGGYRFGTDNATKPFDEWVGRCHGVNCGFTWMRTDDCKYMNTQHTRSPSVAGGSVCPGLDSGRCLHDEKFGWGPCSQKCVMNAEVTGAVPSNDLLEGETE